MGAMKIGGLTVIALLAAFAADAQTTMAAAPVPRVASARRAMEYQTVDMRTLRPRDEANDVLLVVELAGMPVEDFQKLTPKEIFIRAGETRHETVITGAGLVNGTPEIHILFNIPKTLLDMQLVVGDHAPIAFSAAKTIEPVFRREPAPAGHPSALSPADAYARVSALNRGGRFKAPLFGQVELTRLRLENCFGVDLGNGTRLVAESSPGAGLAFLRQGKDPMTAVGVVSLEGNLRIGGVLVPRGEYVVFAGPRLLSFSTDPADHTVDIPLTQAIPESGLRRNAPDMPRMSLVIQDGSASLVIAGNRLAIESVR